MKKVLLLGLLLVFLLPVIGNAGEITSQESKDLIGKAVRSAGYQCPECKILWAKANVPRGKQFKAFCGPAGREGVYQNLIYEVILTPDWRFIVRPW